MNTASLFIIDHITLQFGSPAGTRSILGTREFPSNKTTGPPEKSVTRNTESVLVAPRPVTLQSQWTGCATTPYGPILVIAWDPELMTNALELSAATAIAIGREIPFSSVAIGKIGPPRNPNTWPSGTVKLSRSTASVRSKRLDTLLSSNALIPGCMRLRPRRLPRLHRRQDPRRRWSDRPHRRRWAPRPRRSPIPLLRDRHP